MKVIFSRVFPKCPKCLCKIQYLSFPFFWNLWVFVDGSISVIIFVFAGMKWSSNTRSVVEVHMWSCCHKMQIWTWSVNCSIAHIIYLLNSFTRIVYQFSFCCTWFVIKVVIHDCFLTIWPYYNCNAAICCSMQQCSRLCLLKFTSLFSMLMMLNHMHSLRAYVHYMMTNTKNKNMVNWKAQD